MSALHMVNLIWEFLLWQIHYTLYEEQTLFDLRYG